MAVIGWSMELLTQIRLAMSGSPLNPSPGYFPNSRMHNWNPHPQPLAGSPHWGSPGTCPVEKPYLSCISFLIAVYFRGGNHWLATTELPLSLCVTLAKAINPPRCVSDLKLRDVMRRDVRVSFLKCWYFHSLAACDFQHFPPWVVKLEMYWVHIYSFCIITR